MHSPSIFLSFPFPICFSLPQCFFHGLFLSPFNSDSLSFSLTLSFSFSYLALFPSPVSFSLYSLCPSPFLYLSLSFFLSTLYSSLYFSSTIVFSILLFLYHSPSSFSQYVLPFSTSPGTVLWPATPYTDNAKAEFSLDCCYELCTDSRRLGECNIFWKEIGWGKQDCEWCDLECWRFNFRQSILLLLATFRWCQTKALGSKAVKYLLPYFNFGAFFYLALSSFLSFSWNRCLDTTVLWNVSSFCANPFTNCSLWPTSLSMLPQMLHFQKMSLFRQNYFMLKLCFK